MKDTDLGFIALVMNDADIVSGDNANIRIDRKGIIRLTWDGNCYHTLDRNDARETLSQILHTKLMPLEMNIRRALLLLDSDDWPKNGELTEE